MDLDVDMDVDLHIRIQMSIWIWAVWSKRATSSGVNKRPAQQPLQERLLAPEIGNASLQSLTETCHLSCKTATVKSDNVFVNETGSESF
jgi:hypothetical protein